MFFTSTLPRNVASKTNVWEGQIAGNPFSYSVRSLFVVDKFWPILSVPIPILYTTFTCWVSVAKISAMKRVYSAFRSCKSLTCVFRKLKMSLSFFLYVYGSILLINRGIINMSFILTVHLQLEQTGKQLIQT